MRNDRKLYKKSYMKSNMKIYQLYVRKRKAIISICFVVTMLGMLVGCANIGMNKKNEIEQDFQNDSKKAEQEGKTTSENKEKAADILQQLGAPERLEISPITADGKTAYAVDADIIVPENASPGIYKEKAVEWSVDTVNNLAKKLFDRGEYQQVKPIFCESKEEVLEEQKRLYNRIKDGTDENLMAERIRYLMTEILLDADSGWKTSEYMINDCSYNNIHGILEYIVQGSIHGEIYQITLIEFPNEKGETLPKSACIRIANMKEGYNELDPVATIQSTMTNEQIEKLCVGQPRFEEAVPNTKGLKPAKNICNYDEESARQMALEFLQDCMDVSMMVTTMDCRTGAKGDLFRLTSLNEAPFGENEKIVQDGYLFTCTRSIGNLPCEYTVEDDVNTWKEALSKQQDWMQELTSEAFTVEVSSNGIVGAKLYAWGYETTECMEEHAELLGFDELQAMLITYMNEYNELLCEQQGDLYNENNVTKINEMKLSMVTVNYDGEYTLCPAWILSTVNQNYPGKTIHLMVNAIDGELIYSDITHTGKFREELTE